MAATPKAGTALNSSWTFWGIKMPQKGSAPASYSDLLERVATFDTIEGFGAAYSQMKRPHDLPINYDLSMFRSDSTPMWESFPEGGYWTLRFKKKMPLLHRVWEELLFALIGEAFEDPDVVGITLALRQKEDSVQIWNKDSRYRNNVVARIQAILQLEATSPLEYKQNGGKIKENKQAMAAKTPISGPIAEVAEPVAATTSE